MNTAKTTNVKPAFPVKKEFPFPSPHKTRTFHSPFCICFVYPRKDAPYIVKGESDECEDWLKSQNIPMVVHRICFIKHKTYLWISIYGLPKGIRAYLVRYDARSLSGRYDIPVDVSTIKRTLWMLQVYTLQDSPIAYSKLIRYAPRKWIKELDHFLLQSP